MVQHDVNIPAGFTILDDSPGETRIAYRSAGMSCHLWFLGIGVVGLAGGLAFFAITQPTGLRHVVLGAWWAPFAFFAGISAILYFGWFVIFHLFGETVISVTLDRVAVSRRLFGLALTKSIPRSDVSHLEQI